jgi:hypothetical protein
LDLPLVLERATRKVRLCDRTAHSTRQRLAVIIGLPCGELGLRPLIQRSTLLTKVAHGESRYALNGGDKDLVYEHVAKRSMGHLRLVMSGAEIVEQSLNHVRNPCVEPDVIVA